MQQNNPNQILVKKAGGVMEPFNPDKLVNSLRRVGAEEDTIQRVLKEVQSEIHDGVTTGQIYRFAFKHLRNHSRPVSVKYSLRRALAELGPEGFHFEKYFAEILETKGYQTLNDQILQGACVPHEVDIVAWNEEKLHMIESKFHNEFGFKSDLKIALYVKARFDDIKENIFDYGGKKRHFTNGWLITNTKFTDLAIRYGECNGLTMIGWNYPPNGNLHNLIEESGLHPVTILESLTTEDKRKFIENDILLCRDVRGKTTIFSQLGFNDEKIKEIEAEVDAIINP